MKVHWTGTACDHLRAIHAYIARNSPEYADRIVDRLTRRSQQIAEFPLSGRVVPEFEVPPIHCSDLQVGTCRAEARRYIKPGQIDVLAVIQGAQQIPPGE